MVNEELVNVLRLVFREESVHLRAIIREETNAAVYASEQRLGERLDRVEQRLDRVEQRLDSMEQRLSKLEESHSHLRTEVNFIKVELIRVRTRLDKFEESYSQLAASIASLKGDVSKILLMLDEVTVVINDIRRAQIALETRVEENLVGSWRSLSKFGNQVDGGFKDLDVAIKLLNERMTALKEDILRHEQLPPGEAHPGSDAA